MKVSLLKKLIEKREDFKFSYQGDPNFIHEFRFKKIMDVVVLNDKNPNTYLFKSIRGCMLYLVSYEGNIRVECKLAIDSMGLVQVEEEVMK
jgi:hypothetical protein